MRWTEKADGEKAEKGRMPEKHAFLRLHPEADFGERGIGNKKETVSLKIHKISGILVKMEK